MLLKCVAWNVVSQFSNELQYLLMLGNQIFLWRNEKKSVRVKIYNMVIFSNF